MEGGRLRANWQGADINCWPQGVVGRGRLAGAEGFEGLVGGWGC